MTQIYGSDYASLLNTAARGAIAQAPEAVDPTKAALASLLNAKAGAITAPTQIARQISQLQASPVSPDQGLSAYSAYERKLAALQSQLGGAYTTASYSALSPVFTSGWTDTSNPVLSNNPTNQQAVVAAAKVGDNQPKMNSNGFWQYTY